MKQFGLSIGVSFTILVFMSNMPKKAYQIFDKDGKSTDYEQLLSACQEADIVLFGELHNNPICHWLQVELSQDLLQSKSQNLILGAEMFEADNQIILNEYLQGFIQERHLTNEAKVWNNYATDYKPLVELAKAQQIPFIATNVPRRYASLVSREGLESLEKLDAQAKQWIAPLPIEVDLSLKAYADMLDMMGGSAHGTGGGNKAQNFAKAQAVKDATMAHFILKNWDKNKTFLHFNGAYHSDNFQSIVWYLLKAQPTLKIVTISSIEQKALEKLEEGYLERANFIVAIPSSMTKTY